MELVFLDNNVIDLLASNRLDPVAALQGTHFTLCYTPDLETEYRAAIQRDSVQEQPAAVAAFESVLKDGHKRAFFGFDGAPYAGFDQGMWASQEVCEEIRSLPDFIDAEGRPRKRTDLHLALLAIDHIVITNNSKEGVWRRYPSQGGAVIQWSELGDLLSVGKSLPEAIEEIIAALRKGFTSVPLSPVVANGS